MSDWFNQEHRERTRAFWTEHGTFNYRQKVAISEVFREVARLGVYTEALEGDRRDLNADNARLREELDVMSCVMEAERDKADRLRAQLDALKRGRDCVEEPPETDGRYLLRRPGHSDLVAYWMTIHQRWSIGGPEPVQAEGWRWWPLPQPEGDAYTPTGPTHQHALADVERVRAKREQEKDDG